VSGQAALRPTKTRIPWILLRNVSALRAAPQASRYRLYRRDDGRFDAVWHVGGPLIPRRGSPMTPLRRRTFVFLGAWILFAGVAVLARKAPPVASSRYDVTSVEVRFGGVPGRITAIPTGTVTVKRCHHGGVLPESTPYWLRFAAILLDWDWAAPMPVWSYLVEHPEGVWLIDAGASPRYRDPQAWSFDPVSRRLVHSFIRLDVRDDETLPGRLAALGVDPDQIRGIVLTHQHVDHTGSVLDVSGADIWTSAAEDAAAQTIGAMHPLWRSETTRLRYADSEGSPRAGGAGTSVFLTSDRRVEIVTTPGHTPGSLSVRLGLDGGDVWMIGDTSFTAGALDPDSPTAGIHTDVAAVREQQRWFQTHVEAARVFPSHDPDVPQRLTFLREGG
jgi:N-acyl homoserine lactone hydrolase